MAERKTKRATSGRARSSKTTTKKVAKKSVAKIAAKKTTKKAAKKTTVKKVTKKPSSKKTAIKKAPQKIEKKNSIQIQTAEKKTRAKKTSKSSKKTKKTTQQKFSDNVTIGTSHRWAFKDTSITVFSRVKTDKAIILTARVIGLCFIFTGALLSLVTLSRSYELPLIANTFQAATSSPLNDPVHFDDEMNFTGITDPLDDTTQFVPDPPAVNFDLTQPVGEGEIVPIRFTVEAERINVRLTNKDTGKNTDLGFANTNDSYSWEISWNTAQFFDGEYYVKLIISDKNGYLHIVTAPQRLQLEHIIIEESESNLDTSDTSSGDGENETTTEEGSNTTAEDTASSTAQDTVAVDTSDTTSQDNIAFDAIKYELRTQVPSELTKKQTIEFRAENIVEAKLRVIHQETQKTFSSNNVYQYEPRRWKYVLDPHTYIEPGQYTLRHQLKASTGEIFFSPAYSFEIINLATGSTTRTEDINDIHDDEFSQSADSDTETDGDDATDDETFEVSPRSKIILSDSIPLRDLVSLHIKTVGASQTEVYIRRQNSLKDLFLGLAERKGDAWQLSWDTTQTPNGTYFLFSKHKNQYGTYFSDFEKIIVLNDSTQPDITSDTQQYIDDIQKTADLVSADTDPIAIDEEDSIASSDTEDQFDDLSLDSETRTTITSSTSQKTDTTERAERILRESRKELEVLLYEYSKALRSGDSEKITEAETELENYRMNVESDDTITNPIGASREELFDELNKKIEYEVAKVDQTEKIIQERAGVAATTDSDQDGVTDYDEVTLFNTDPFSADTDGDGFTDEAEILGGFDPTDPVEEAAIVFESPKDTGVIRDDVFVIDGIVSDTSPTLDTKLSETSEPVEQQPAAAVLTGRALPNSFVTIHIFSNPIVVTVRTNDDGSWSYRFEKELDDGEHTAYVSVTDNAGRIVAKSQPFAFVKQAQAFTPVDAEAASAGTLSAADNQPSLFDQTALVVALAGIVVSLGLVLLLISVFMSRREEPLIAQADLTPATHGS